MTGQGRARLLPAVPRLNAELASAQQSQKLETRIAEIDGKLATRRRWHGDGGSRSAGERAGQDDGPRHVDKVQTALTIFVALLIEIGSALRHVRGLRLLAPRRRSRREPCRGGPRPASGERCRRTISRRPCSSRSRPPSHGADEAPTSRRPTTPQGQRQQAAAGPCARQRRAAFLQREGRCRFRRLRASRRPSSTRSIARWCEDNEKEPFAHPRVTREIGELGVKKERIGKRTRYFGIALKSTEERQTDKKLPNHYQEQRKPKGKLARRAARAALFYWEAPSPAQRRRSLW